MEDRLQAQARLLIQNHEDTLRVIGDKLKIKWRSLSPKRDTADQTMYELGRVDGMVEGVETLIAELERIAAGNYD